MRWPVLVAVLLLPLAGCAADQPPTDGDTLVPADSFDDYKLDEVQAQYGVIRGVVVDPTLNPLAGAQVELVDQDRNATTSDGGLFAFKDLAPGIYFLKVTLDRYETIQTSADVVANVAEPDVVRVLLQRIPGTEPLVVAGTFKGFMTCSIRIPTLGFVDGCGVFGDIGVGSTQRVDLTYEGTNMMWWQGEMVWKPTSPTSERLCLGVSADTIGGDLCGPSPLMEAMDRHYIEIEDLEAGESFEMVGYPDHLAADASGNLVVNQEFEFFHHIFYNFVPPAGWLFARDGAPILPP